MNDVRKWVSTRHILPHEGQKVYYFCDFLGIFRGEFHTIKSEYNSCFGSVDPNKFSSNHGVLDSDEVSYWMPYDHSLRDMIPLPPDYHKVDINNSQAIINTGLDLNVDEIEIPQEDRQILFSYEIMGEF